MGTDSFIVNIKTNVYKDIADNVKKIFHTSNYEVERLLPIGKTKKKIGLMKDELGVKIMTEFVGLGPKTYSYLIDDDSGGKKAKGTKKSIIKQKFKFENYKNVSKIMKLY